MLLFYKNFILYEDLIGIDNDIFPDNLSSNTCMLQHYINNSLNKIQLYNIRLSRNCFLDLNNDFKLMRKAILTYFTENNNKALFILNNMEKRFKNLKEINISPLYNELFKKDL